MGRALRTDLFGRIVSTRVFAISCLHVAPPPSAATQRGRHGLGQGEVEARRDGPLSAEDNAIYWMAHAHNAIYRLIIV